MDVIIVCHTEFGRVVKNGRIRECVAVKSSVNGVEQGVHNLARVAETHGAKVTFAVMPEAAQQFPKISQDHEIGLHVHPGWEHWSKFGINFQVGDAYLKQHCAQASDSSILPDHCFDEQLDMIKVGQDHIFDCLGVDPTVFVAGRWSINSDTIKALLNAGFSHECSAVPGTKTGWFDWSTLPRICMPYHPQPTDYQKRGALPLLMVPISQMLAGGNVNPEGVPFWGLSWLKACFVEYFKQDLPTFHICLHSPCMTDPYLSGAMENFLRFISRHDVKFKCASEVQEGNRITARAQLLPYIKGINTTILTQPIPRMRELAARVMS